MPVQGFEASGAEASKVSGLGWVAVKELTLPETNMETQKGP